MHPDAVGEGEVADPLLGHARDDDRAIAVGLGRAAGAFKTAGEALELALLRGTRPQAGTAGLAREFARFRDEPVTAAELQEAKNELLTTALRGRETAEGQAETLAEAVIINGDARAADRRLAEIAAVTPADIQRVARRWLRDEASGAVRYLPEEARNGATGDTIRTPATVAAWSA